MKYLSLNGPWNLGESTRNLKLEGSVPGCVHVDLLNAGMIPDPYYRDNESKLAWIGEVDWLYERIFEVSFEWIASGVPIVLCAEGLDTLAEVRLNGVLLGETDNMFRSWEFVLNEAVQVGRNELSILFKSTLPYIEEGQGRRYMAQHGVFAERILGSCRVRKEQCNYGWDWGPKLVTCGIWRSIGIEYRDQPKLRASSLEQTWRGDSVELSPIFEVVGQGACAGLCEIYTKDGTLVCDWKFDLDNRAAYVLENPDRWWPRGLGAQALYTVKMYLLDETEVKLAEQSFRVGMRKVELVQEKDEWGRSFYFRVNGVAFFAKGTNWIPADCFDSRVSDEAIEDLLQSSTDAHMNMVRVWGGGVYERDRFYEICDELGLCVWQDFMFACAAYPFGEKDFRDNVEAEATEVIGRLRHHASLVCWCGNNEIEQMHPLVGDNPGAMTWAEYKGAFDEMLPELVQRYDPQTPYWPSSAHTPDGDRAIAWSESSGDAHTWEVWHGREPFEWYRSSFHRFCSEFGFQSFPEPATIAQFAEAEDYNVTAPIMEYHQRSGIGNRTILEYLLDWFRLPTKFEDIVWASQILQALAVKYAVEHWRRHTPQCMGALYWQLNDTWAGPSWSSIDHGHRWKALHYEARRFFAPVAVSILEDMSALTAELFLTADPTHGREGEVRWRLETTSGMLLGEGNEEGSVEGGATVSVVRLEIGPILAKSDYKASDVILFVEYGSGDTIIARNFVTFVRPKALSLKNPEINFEVRKRDETGWEIWIEAKYPALWVWFSCEAVNLRFEDNFFSLKGGGERVIRVDTADAGVALSEDLKIEVGSLHDFWN